MILVVRAFKAGSLAVGRNSFFAKKLERASFRRPFAHDGLETLAAHYVQQSFKPHAHAEYLIGVITAGVHSVWCRGDWHTVSAGTVMTMRPGDVHYGNAGIEEGWVQRMLYVSEATMAELLADNSGNDRIALPDFNAPKRYDSELADRLERIHKAIHGPKSLLMRDTALVAFADVVTTLASGSSVDHRDVALPDYRAGRMIDYLHAHVEEDVSLGELSSLAGLGRRQTIDLFKRSTGLPPHAYHIGLKVRRVQTLVREGRSLAVAAAEAGFADQSHMTRHFTAIVGTTPAAYGRG